MTLSSDPKKRLRVVRLCVSVGLLIALAAWLDVGQIAERLRGMRPSWVGLALALSVVQVVVSAWRWRFTAGRLGIELPFSVALREYYLAMFLNQVIPGGVVGDVSRAWRHARAGSTPQSAGGSAVRAVILERASGQVVMAIVATLSLAALPLSFGAGWWWSVLAASVARVGLWVWLRGRRLGGTSLVDRFWRDAQVALFSGSAFPLQFASSTVVVVTYLMTYLVAARAIGVDTSAWVLLPLVAPVLLTMLVPVTVAGWGVREGAAATLWGVAGLTVVDGVAISVAYGLVVLLSTLPGALVLVKGRGS